jgi:hypothetical protein
MRQNAACTNQTESTNQQIQKLGLKALFILSRPWMSQVAGKQLLEASKADRLEDVKKLLGQGVKPDAYRDQVGFLS